MNWKVIAAASAAVAIAIAAFLAYLAWIPHYYIVAWPLTGDRRTGLTGAFRIYRAPVFSFGFPDKGRTYSVGGLISERFGGGCIVFPASDLGFTTMARKQCNSNVECSNPDPAAPRGTEAAGVYTPDPSNPGHQEHRFGYCDVGTHQCWSRPIYTNSDFSKTNSIGAEAILCRKRIKQAPFNDPPWPENIDNPVSVSSADLSGFGLKSGTISARVAACLQGTYATKDTGCSSVNGTERIETMGQATIVKP